MLEPKMFDYYKFKGQTIAKELGLPELDYGKIKYDDVSTTMSDNTKLESRVFYPEGEGPWPVVLVRNPYVGMDVDYQYCLPYFSASGYVLVLNCTRGCVDSDGEWVPFINEREDGKELIDWIAKQSWCDGNIGCFGASYLGHTQWSIASYDHPALKTMYIRNMGAVGYDNMYRRGMFHNEMWTPWAITMTGNNRFKQLSAGKNLEHFLNGYAA